MTLSEIRKMPTGLDPESPGPIHESVFRSYHVLGKVREWLLEGTPSSVIVEMMDDLMERRGP